MTSTTPKNKENDHPESARMNEHYELIASTKPTTKLEIAMAEVLHEKQAYIEYLKSEIQKLNEFTQRRKQGYKRRRKESDAPVRPLSAYNYFMKYRFQEITDENEKVLKSGKRDLKLKKVPPADVIKTAGDAWAKLPADEKAVYEALAAKDRKRYEQEMADYMPAEKPGGKRGKTAYNMFFTAYVAQNKEKLDTFPKERGAVARVVGEAWKQLSEEERDKYARRASRHNEENPIDRNEPEEDDNDEDHDDDILDAERHGFHPDLPMLPPPGVPPHMMPDPRVYNPHHHPAYYPMYPGHPMHMYGHHDYSQHPGRAGQSYNNGYMGQSRHSYD